MPQKPSTASPASPSSNSHAGVRDGAASAPASASASASENHARGAVVPPAAPPAKTTTTTTTLGTSESTPSPKLRSCVICRRRKVRCDRLSPCTNCRRANIACVLPSDDRPPRWARRLDRITTNNAAVAANGSSQGAGPGTPQVLDRLRTLEGLVKELSGQLEAANAAAATAANNSSEAGSPMSTSARADGRGAQEHTRSLSANKGAGFQTQLGRFVVKDPGRSRYVSSGFWARVSLDALKLDLAGDGSESDEQDSMSLEETPSTQAFERTPSERHSFLFGHNLSNLPPQSLRHLHPLPSQVPFFLSTFDENVNMFIRIVHMPTVANMMRDSCGIDMSRLAPANEALVFSMYYAAIASMEEEDVMINFATPKAELNLKYRLGLERALANADFLNIPDLTLVQAFVIFLFLVRRYDSPRFVWMMTGLAIRMAHALGLHRDGSHFEHLTPFEVEMRRRVWWALCILDVRASEDQGMDLTITKGSFDTKLPLNINDTDLDPKAKEPPSERHALTDMSFALPVFEVCDISRQIHAMAPGVGEDTTNLETQSCLLDGMYESFERNYLQYTKSTDDIAAWVGATCTRLVMAKMTLLVHLPALFSSPSDHFSEELRNRLLVAAIEVAEYNDILNSERACRNWRWIYQTYTHWHAIVFLLIEICRRQWSPVMERSWLALQSRWLIPDQPDTNKGARIWVPLRKLMSKARANREAELGRLRGADARTIEESCLGDRDIPVPSSAGPFPDDKGEELFLKYWCSLVAAVSRSDEAEFEGVSSKPSNTVQGACTDTRARGQESELCSQYSRGHQYSASSHSPVADVGSDLATAVSQTLNHHRDGLIEGQTQNVFMENGGIPGSVQPEGASYGMPPAEWSSSADSMVPDMASWWATMDSAMDPTAGIDVDVDAEPGFDWSNWLESAKNMDLNRGFAGSG